MFSHELGVFWSCFCAGLKFWLGCLFVPCDDADCQGACSELLALYTQKTKAPAVKLDQGLKGVDRSLLRHFPASESGTICQCRNSQLFVSSRDRTATGYISAWQRYWFVSVKVPPWAFSHTRVIGRNVSPGMHVQSLVGPVVTPRLLMHLQLSKEAPFLWLLSIWRLWTVD